MIKAGKKSESSFFHSFLAVFSLLEIQQISFFKQVCLFEKMPTCWFSSIGYPICKYQT